jgi:hypothetical protein
MHTALKTLLAAAASLIAQAAFAQTTTYSYTGNNFQFFSCGPSNAPGGGTLGCLNQPAPGNPLTSYIASDHVTATLTLSSPLAANLPFQDVKSLQGFSLTMSDGHQTLSSGTSSAGFVSASVSTNGTGQIANWNLVIFGTSAVSNEIISQNDPSQPFTLDQGILACCDPARHGDLALNINSPGTWGAGGTPTALSFGGFVRVIQFDAYDKDDFTGGGDLIPRIVSGTGSQLGMNWARTSFRPLNLTTPTGPVTLNFGPSAGAWSDSNQGAGSARALAYVTFTAPPGGITFRANANFNGEYEHDWFGLPDGNLASGGEVLVADTVKLNAAMAASHLAPAQFFLGSSAVTAGITPQSAFAQLQSTLSGAGVLLAPAASFFPDPASTAFDIIRSYPINTPMVHVDAGKQFTIILDASAYSFVGGFPLFGIGTGVADFYNSLDPAPNFLTDANGNPVSVIPPSGSAPTPLPTPANLLLTVAQPSALVGTSAALNATVTDSTSAPLKDIFVNFKVTAGPNAGLKGAGTTDVNGHASFSYTGLQGAGTDTVQANVVALTSNLAREAWTLSPLASSTSCNGTFNGTINGNVTVSAGQNCVLLGGKVTGHILVTGGSLSLSNFTVGGNLLVQGGSVQTGPALTVLGNLQVQNLPASSPASRICNSVVQGNLQVQSNAAGVQIGGDLTCPGNTVAGNLLVQNNTGPTQVTGNTVQKNLDCLSNTALTGGGNTAKQKLDQCVAF